MITIKGCKKLQLKIVIENILKNAKMKTVVTHLLHEIKREISNFSTISKVLMFLLP